MQQFTHYIVTRYNIVKNWVRDKEGKQTLGDEWMESRLALFSQFLVPSVQKQSNPNFHWLVYCNRSTSEKYLRAIRKEVEKVGSGEVCLVDDIPEAKKHLYTRLSKITTPFVITSRVDTDDALGLEFVNRIQDHFIPENRVLLNLTRGICYDTFQKVLTSLDEELNCFCSLIEKSNPEGTYLTVLGFPHHNPPKDLKVIDIESENSWLRVVHTRNVLNETSGKPVFSPNNLEKNFNLPDKTFEVSPVSSMLYILRRLLPWAKQRIPAIFSRKRY